MKTKNILLLLVILSVLLCTCNDTTVTTEPEGEATPSVMESAPSKGHAPDLTLARQVFDRLQANEGGVFATEGRYSLSRHM